MAIFPQHYWNSGDCLLIQFKNDRGNLSHCFIASLYILKCLLAGFPGSSAGKESTCSAGDSSLIPGLERSPAEGISYALQCSWASLMAKLVKNLPVMLETWVQSLGGKIPWTRERLPTPVFWPGEFHGLCSPWGHKELDTTEPLSL